MREHATGAIDERPRRRVVYTAKELPSFGGSLRGSGLYGDLAMMAIAATDGEGAALLARAAWREATAFCERMDRKLGRPFEIADPEAFARLGPSVKTVIR